MAEPLRYAKFPLEYKADADLVVGYANKAIVDAGRDLIPAEVWLSALRTFFREGAPVKLLHRPKLVAGETVWLKAASDGLILASRPYPEVRPLIEKGWLRAYSIGFVPKRVEYTPDGVRVITELDLYEVSYVDEPMNPGCYFFTGKMRMNMNHEVVFDREKGVVTILGVTPEEMAEIAAGIQELLLKAGVPAGTTLKGIEFKAAEPPAPAEPEEATDEELAKVNWDEVFTIYYSDDAPEEKVRWSRRFINRLPDSSFAVIEPAYERGETKDKNCRHLPHHGPGGGGTRNVNLDLPHLRNAFARAPLIKPVTDSISTEELRRRALEHLEHHRSALTTAQEERASLVDQAVALKRAVEEAQKPAEPSPELKALEEGLSWAKDRIQALSEELASQKGTLAELKDALTTLIEVVQSIVPPPRSQPVLDPTGGRNKRKWGIFER